MRPPPASSSNRVSSRSNPAKASSRARTVSNKPVNKGNRVNRVNKVRASSPDNRVNNRGKGSSPVRAKVSNLRSSKVNKVKVRDSNPASNLDSSRGINKARVKVRARASKGRMVSSLDNSPDSRVNNRGKGNNPARVKVSSLRSNRVSRVNRVSKGRGKARVRVKGKVSNPDNRPSRINSRSNNNRSRARVKVRRQARARVKDKDRVSNRRSRHNKARGAGRGVAAGRRRALPDSSSARN